MLLVFLLSLIVPASASAHEMHVYTINGVEYAIEVGFITETNIVDDPNGIHVEIYRDGKAFAGAQNTLQVELRAADKQKTLSLEPAWGEEGVYVAPYIATVPTSVTATLVGTLEGVSVDLPYTCAEGTAAEEPVDQRKVALSDGVTQTLKTGRYACPVARDDLGFPERSASAVDLAQTAAAADTASGDAATNAQKADVLAAAALIVSLAALGMSFRRR